jgi:hypothetical protein
MRETRRVCPKCGRADAIRKVKSIVDEGTTYTDSNRLGMSISGDDTQFYTGFGRSVSRTELASALAPPQKPAQPFRRGWSGIFPKFHWNCAVSMLGLMICGAVGSFPLLFTTYRENPLLIFVPVIIILCASAIMIRWAWLSSRRETRKLREAEAQYPLQVEAWKHALERWEQLYYCQRDDGVFIPAQTQLIPVNQMQAFLYSANKKKR